MRFYQLYYLPDGGTLDQWEIYDSLENLRERVRHPDLKDKRHAIFVQELEADPIEVYLDPDSDELKEIP